MALLNDIFSFLSEAISFVVVTLPTWLFRVLSYTLTLTLTFRSLAVITLLLVVAGYLFLRYRYLNVYSRRSTETPAKSTNGQAFDLRPDTTSDGDRHDAQTSYPGEFLSAFLSSIRVFGYLEKPVFHELARHLQTRRLLAGDTMSDLSERERSFYFVVDGCVQVFAKRNEPPSADGYVDFDDDDSDDDGDDAYAGLPGHVLLNEVLPGGTLSSLFSILSLFTENVPVRHSDESAETETYLTYGAPSDGEPLSPVDATLHHRGESVSMFPAMSRRGSSATETSASTAAEAAALAAATASLPSMPYSPTSASEPPSSSHRRDAHSTPTLTSAAAIERTDIVFRATADTTLAVIPAEAFKRVTEKFPNTSAHIVQVILTRFQRLTFKTMENYLGLTKELLNIERRLNEVASYDLPADCHREGGLERLRQRFLGGNRHKPGSNTEQTEVVPNEPRSPRLRQPPRTPFRLDGDVERRWERRSKTPCATLDEDEAHGRTPQTTPHTDGYSLADEQYLREKCFACIKKSLGMLTPGVDLAQLSVMSRSSSRSREEGPATGGQQRDINPLGLRLPESLTLSRDTSIDDGDMMSSPGTPQLVFVPDLRNDVRILFFPKGATLVKQNEYNVGIYMVIDGVLDIFVNSGDANKKRHSRDTSSATLGKPSAHPLSRSAKRQKSLFLIRPGGIVGYLSALTGHPSFVNVRASTDTFVAYLPKESLERIVERYPNVLLTLAKRLITMLSPLVMHIDFALEWVQVNAGQILYRQQDPSDSIHVVLNGRLRTITEDTSSFKIFCEHGRGESIGELEVLTDSPRSSTLYAIRDSELARLPKTLFVALSLRHPEISVQMSRIIATRTRMQRAEPIPRNSLVVPHSAQGDFGRNNVNLKTVAILPVSGDVPVLQFAEQLRNALGAVGATALHLDHTTVTSVLGRHAFSKLGKLKMMHWLAEQEEKYRIILYVADSGAASPWTQRCVRQADCIFLVALGDSDPSVGEFERVLLGMKSTARKELILLHNERHCQPGSTRAWLKSRIWIQAHHHVQMQLPRRPDMINAERRKHTLLNLHLHLQDYLRMSSKKPPTPYTDNRSDFARLARRILGKSVGLVLGGGGARGLAHVGVIRALEESGVPVDMIGGTSMGAFIGGLYARDPEYVAILGFAKMFSSRMISVWRQVLDLTYPITAYFTGHEFNRGLWKCFAETQIEDLWINYYCNTTNITHSRMECHHFGYVWRFIRASMSLSGLMPPVSDGGNLLLDGGYMDNLTVSYMKSLGANMIIAVDVGSVDDTSPVYYGDSLSGFWVLLQRLNPFRGGPAIPSLADIQQRLAYVSSVKQLEEAKATPGCLYVRPPVEPYGTLEFGSFDTIVNVGYQHGRECLREWRKEGLYSALGLRQPDAVAASMADSAHAPMLSRRNSL